MDVFQLHLHNKCSGKVKYAELCCNRSKRHNKMYNLLKCLNIKRAEKITQ